MFCIYSHKNSFKNIRTDAKIFPSTIAYWSGLVIFKEKQENPDETGMVAWTVCFDYTSSLLT